MSGIGAVEFVFLLLLFFVVVFGLLARKLETPYPIIMVIGGLVLSDLKSLGSAALTVKGVLQQEGCQKVGLSRA